MSKTNTYSNFFGSSRDGVNLFTIAPQNRTQLLNLIVQIIQILLMSDGEGSHVIRRRSSCAIPICCATTCVATGGGRHVIVANLTTCAAHVGRVERREGVGRGVVCHFLGGVFGDADGEGRGTSVYRQNSHPVMEDVSINVRLF